METGVSIFLTGKAGTGKTTFLHHIVENCHKRSVVVAPTGVAAVNAGGVTIHSFFQLPFCPYLPDIPELVTEYQMPDSKKQLRKSKVDIIRTLDLLIIDEISMVRADLLDAIDAVLRRYRRNSRPFGGVQLLMIGDVQQLAPVVTDEEKPYMERVYPSPFFFHSKVLQRVSYITIQLTTIYRQQDPTFVNLLNNIRDNIFDADTLSALNARVVDADHINDKSAKQASSPILLTTHNFQADRVNKQRLDELTTEPFTLTAIVEGNFPLSSASTDEHLVLKPGAQVMFVKNDGTGMHRYYNGKIATVDSLGTEMDSNGDEHTVVVVTDEDGKTINVGMERWENIKYEIDPADNQIKQIVDGTFTQYPLKTAWAITIHKAQGLTFDRVQVDAAAAFAYGQVYVALSRCRSLEGLTLLSPITGRNSIGSNAIEQFNNTLTPADVASQRLDAYRKEYYFDILFELFDFSALHHDVDRIERLFGQNLRHTYPLQTSTLSKLVGGELNDLVDVSDRFRRQLIAISQQPDSQSLLDERVAKATVYFLGQIKVIDEKVRPLLDIPIDSKEVKAHMKDLAEAYLTTSGIKSSLLKLVHQQGFDIASYQKTKVDFTLQKTKKQKDPLEAFRGVKYPKLGLALSRWRKSVADERGIPVSVVLQQKDLLAIADTLPRNKAELQKVPGIGKTKASQYGMDILQIINDFCNDNPDLFPQSGSLNVFESQPVHAESGKPNEPIWQRAAAMYAEGKGIEEIADSLGRAKSTVEGYIFNAVDQGVMTPELVLDAEGQDEILTFLLENRALTSLKSVYDHFDGRYSYLQIRVAKMLSMDL